VPVHGEPKHLAANAQIAKQLGISHQLVGLNGDLYSLAQQFSIKRKAISAPRIAL
jgi:ribonuclease J